MSQITSALTPEEIRRIRWVYRCSDVRMNGEIVEGFKFVILLGTCGNWEPLGTRDEVMDRVARVVAAHGGNCP